MIQEELNENTNATEQTKGTLVEQPEGNGKASPEQPRVEENREEELINDLKRVMAEFDNARKRWALEKTEAREYASIDLVKELLPLCDDFENALNSLNEEERKCVEPLANKFFAIMQKNGLKALAVKKGDEFDSMKMDAVQVTNGEDGKIIEIISNGFVFKEKLLRPTQVIVGKQLEKQEANEK